MPADAVLPIAYGGPTRPDEIRVAPERRAGAPVDHVEVLYDPDVEAAQTAERLGLALVRAGTVNDHPAFIDMLAELVRAEAR